MRRLTIITLLSLLLFSCMPKTGEHAKAPEPEAPLLTSLKDSGLPCFGCHAYERFARDERGFFSHPRHMAFEVHCNQCHDIKAHKQTTIRRDACDKCHNLKSFTFTASGLPVAFSHQSHAKKYNCAQCHPKLFNMKQGTTRITMDEMYQGGTCGTCHNGKAAFSAQECTKCHAMTSFKKDLKYPSSGLHPAVFSHQFHTAMFECGACHPGIFRFKKDGTGMKMDAIYQGKFCGSCHNGQMAFGSMECNRCHK